MRYLRLLVFLLDIASVPVVTPTPVTPITVRVDVTPGVTCPDATYEDSKGVAWTCKECKCIPYYKELVAHGNDPGKCGLAPFETGTWDPLYFVCRRHDAMYDYQKDHDGKVEESILITQLKFTVDAATAGAIGLYAFVGAVVYIPLVWMIGAPIQLFRRYTGKDEGGDDDANTN